MSSSLRENIALQSKGILVAVVVVFSSLSFSLGYFVGKIGREERTETASQILEAAQPVQAGENTEAMPEKSPPPQKGPGSPETEKAPEQDPLIPENAYSRPAARAPGAGTVNKTEEKTSRPEKADTKKTAKAGSAQKTKEVAAPDGSRTSAVKYTVQLGALKSPAEAKKLKSTFLRKGYKAYISSSQDAGSRHKIYKVRAGEFEQKKDAEILALKINKSEGLKSFVTPKD